MDEIILRLKGVSALLVAISEVDETVIITDIGIGVKMIDTELKKCIREMEKIVADLK